VRSPVSKSPLRIEPIAKGGVGEGGSVVDVGGRGEGERAGASTVGKDSAVAIVPSVVGVAVWQPVNIVKMRVKARVLRSRL
jgi:hypothetical protein